MGNQRLVTDGGRKLRAYIDEHYKTGGVPKFCEEKGLPRINVQRALNGERKRISVDLAVAIELATGGWVVVKDWQSSTGRVPPKASARRARKAA